MVRDKVVDQVDRASGKAKQWVGRASGNARLQRQGWMQSAFASTKITVRKTVQKLGAALRK